MQEEIRVYPYSMIDDGKELIYKIVKALKYTKFIELIDENNKNQNSFDLPKNFDDLPLLEHISNPANLFFQKTAITRKEDYQSLSLSAKHELLNKDMVLLVVDDQVEIEHQNQYHDESHINHRVMMWFKTDEKTRPLVNKLLERNEPLRIGKKHHLMKNGEQDCYVCLPLYLRSSLTHKGNISFDELWQVYEKIYQEQVHFYLPLVALLVAPIDELDKPIAITTDIVKKWKGNLLSNFQEHYDKFVEQIRLETPDLPLETIHKMMLLDYELHGDSSSFEHLNDLQNLGFYIDLDQDFFQKLKESCVSLEVFKQQKKKEQEDLLVGGVGYA